MQKAISFNGATVVFVKVIDHGIHIWYMTKYKAISMLTNANWKEKYHCYQKNEKNPKKTPENYENNEKTLQEQVRKNYWKLCNKEKEIKRESGRNRYRNMSEETAKTERIPKKKKKKKEKKNYCGVKKKLLKKFSFLFV